MITIIAGLVMPARVAASPIINPPTMPIVLPTIDGSLKPASRNN